MPSRYHRTPDRRATASLRKVTTVFGVPNTLVVISFFFVNDINDLVSDLLPNWFARLVWLAALAAAALTTHLRWQRRYRAAATAGAQPKGATSFGQDGTRALPNKRGLIIVLGLDSAEPGAPAARLFTEAVNTEYVAFLGTPQTLERRTARTIIARHIPAAGLIVPDSHIRFWEQGNNAQSVADFRESAAEAIAWMRRQGLQPEEIVIDTSSGRRAAGYGAMTAGSLAGVEVQYLAEEWDHLTNRPVAGRAVFKVVETLTAP